MDPGNCFLKRATIGLLFLSLLVSQSICPETSSGEEQAENLITLDVKNMDINSVLKIVAEQGNLNIIASKNVKGNITAKLKNMPVEQALWKILEINEFVYEKDAGLIRVMTEQEYVARHGKSPGDEVKVFELTHADVNTLAAVLNQVKTKTGKVISDVRTNTLILVDSAESIARMGVLIKELDVAGLTETRTFVLNYAKPEDLEAKIKTELTKDFGTIQADERTSTIVVTDRPDKMEKIAALVSSLDKKTKQVLIEARILETSLSDEQKMGIDWSYQSPATRPQEHDIGVESDFSQNLAGSGLTFRIGTLGEEEFAVTLEMLRDSTDTNIISSPRLTTLSNQTAKIVVGTEYPVATYQLLEETGTYEITGWELLEYGIMLEVTPTVNEDNFITMTIAPQVSDAVGTVGEDPHQRPIIETQEVTTQTMIKDGQTIVIAGLIKNKNQKIVKKIPLLGSIPILGIFFRKTTEESAKTDLIIFITAHILESGEESVEITSKDSEQARGRIGINGDNK